MTENPTGRKPASAIGDIDRRQMLASATAGAAALVLNGDLQAREATDWYSRTGTKNGFLSPSNPLATVGQRTVEDRAMRLMERPELVKARNIVAMLLKNVAGWPFRDQIDRLEIAINEHMFHHALRAANGDPNSPEVVRFMVPPHHWFGRDVPGSRWGGDSPDFIYRTIPIAHGGRYEIRGMPTGTKPPIVFYALMSEATASPEIQFLLESLDMEFSDDGSFVITVDDTPPNGRRNHMQTRPGAEFLMVRDALGDWLNQSANALTVTRLNPDTQSKTEEDMARRAAKIALDGVYYAYFMWVGGRSVPPNTVPVPFSTGTMGAIATQWGTMGAIELDQGKALIVRANAAGAEFRNAFLFDLCMMTNGYGQRTASFNMSQMAPDEDGNFTYVIAHEDPGTHNWLDTGGLRRTAIGQRWQAFTRGREHEAPWMTTKLVRLDSLDRELPDGIRRIDAEGRKAQLQERTVGFGRRFADS